VRDKLAITQKLVDLLPPDAWTVDQARITWWYNIRDTGGMRLTKHGFDAFVTELDLEYYEYTIPDPEKFTQRTILALDRNLQMPYYMLREKTTYTKLYFFGSREAVLANLYGDLDRFLNNYN
jgi:hypothetical protein